MAAAPHRCPDGHELSSTRSPCRVCHRAQIEATLAACCPELSKDAIAAAVSATITSPAVARDLAAALAAGPEVLAAGAPPVVARLGVELRARGARLKEPACAICGRTGRPLIRVGTAGLCGRCRAHQLARPCSACGRVRVVVKKGGDGTPLCFSCAPRAERVCARCGRLGVIARRAQDGEGEICDRCFRPPLATCSACGRRKPCHFVATGRPICASCSPRAEAACAHCGATRPPTANWPEGPVCEPCYRAALSRRGTCERCGAKRRLVSPPGPQARLCCDCAGVPPLMACAVCGIEDRLYRDGRCVRCALTEEAARLQQGAPPELHTVYAAIAAARQPYSAHNWLRSSGAARILAALASGELALTHEALDTHPNERAVRFLRQLLVANGVLAARDEAMAALEAWVSARLAEVDDPAEASLLRSYATWGVLREARARAQATPRTRTATAHAKSCLLAAIAFLAFLNEREVPLAKCRQADVDAWTLAGGSSAPHLRDFLSWAESRKLLAPLKVPARRREEGTAMGSDTRLDLVRRLLHDEELRLGDRVAGCLVLLYAQQLSRIVALTTNRVRVVDGDVYLALGTADAIVPDPLGQLLLRLATEAHPYAGVGTPTSSPWLFPGLHPGRPLHPSTLGQRLRRLGVHTMTSRRRALMELASELPGAVLAELLGLHPNTAVHWVEVAGGDWNNYAAEVARARS